MTHLLRKLVCLVRGCEERKYIIADRAERINGKIIFYNELVFVKCQRCGKIR